MWIEQVLIHQIPPFRDDNSHPIEFCRGFNLVRGANGIGKTTVLEALALLGHLPLYRELLIEARALRQTNVSCRFVLEQHDIEAMSSTLSMIDELAEADCSLANSVRAPEVRQTLAERIARLEPNAVVEFGFSVRERGKYADLKDILSNEQRLSTDVTLNVTDLSDALVLKFLIGIARPETSHFEVDYNGNMDFKKPLAWFLSPRRKLLEEAHRHPRTVPGFIGYFHTDMYRWGVGNDVRESPKELFHKSTPLMIVERFRLFPLVNATDGPLIREFDLVSDLWKKIISPDGAKRLSSVRLREYAEGERTVEVGISNDPINIISSGENQALFLLLWLISNCAYNSCLLIDEPEIHLSPGAAHRAIELVQAVARARDCQVICATHAAVVPRGVRARRNPLNRMIYLESPDKAPLDGEEAVQAISRDFQETIDELISALRPSTEG
jgi:ABC-type cobalamin/Fe3+-siderophores transport system ATPase subunit